MTRRTKIIATLGPSSEEKTVIRDLMEAGMNVARINFSHGSEEQCLKIVKNIRALEKETGKLVSILGDLQGPKIRLGALKENIQVKKGDVLTFSTRSEKNTIWIPSNPHLPEILKKGDRLLIEDGLIRTKILSTKSHLIRAKVETSGILKSRKGINIPDSTLPASAALTSKDKKDLKFAIEVLKVDAIAVSFVESEADLLRVRKKINAMTQRPVKIIAKIERKKALENLESILAASDGVMVARGDLAIETKAERVPIEQKRIVALAKSAGKPVIIATQILQSMVENPIPTRAEIADAAEAVFELADGFMLSNESAVGKFPVKAVQTLAQVARTTENEIFAHQELFPIATEGPDNEDESLALNACVVAEQIDAKAIVVLTKEGYTARAVLKHRPKTPVIVVTPAQTQVHALNLLWGIKSILVHQGTRSEEVHAFLKKEKILKGKDKAVFIKLSDQKRSFVVI